jgi:hypothetical protein
LNSAESTSSSHHTATLFHLQSQFVYSSLLSFVITSFSPLISPSLTRLAAIFSWETPRSTHLVETNLFVFPLIGRQASLIVNLSYGRFKKGQAEGFDNVTIYTLFASELNLSLWLNLRCEVKN